MPTACLSKEFVYHKNTVDTFLLYNFHYISGNGIGDVGARLLAKALQLNTNLR